MGNIFANYDFGSAVRRPSYTSTILLGFLVLAVATQASGQNLVVNGSFEEPDVSNDRDWASMYGQNWVPGLPGCPPDDRPDQCYSILVPGWSVLWTDTGEPGRLEIQRGLKADVLPFSGQQKAELDTHHRVGWENNNVTIYQNLNTCRGSLYQLTYSWAPRTNLANDNAMSVRIDNVTVAVHNAMASNIGWMTEVVQFEAMTESTMLEFRSYGTNTTLGVFIDDVSVISLGGGLCDDPPEECPNPEGLPLCHDEAGNPLSPPTTLTFVYDADSYTNHDQGDKVSVIPADPAFPGLVYLKVYHHDGTELGTSPPLGLDGEYTVTSALSHNGKLNPELIVEIWEVDGGLIQTVGFHTSCSMPLNIGDTFGGITIKGY